MTTTFDGTLGSGSVTSPAGFSAAGLVAGIKASGKPDLACVVNTGTDDTIAGVFTRNRIAAAPVLLSRKVTAQGHGRAVVLNSGNANACTGQPGLDDAHQMSLHTGLTLGLAEYEVAVCSTGLIGDRLPMDKVLKGVAALPEHLGDSEAHGMAAATAILTTDLVTKTAAITTPSGYTIGGMAKGAGMMSPSVATMLVVLTTDAAVGPAIADQALRTAAQSTFNRVDVDASTSTNDSVLLLANGESGVSVRDETAVAEFTDALTSLCDTLAQGLIADAEGVTKRVTITVTGAKNEEEAGIAARVLARDPLTKCAFFGSDPNWGRVLAAVGTAPVELSAGEIMVSFNGHTVCEHSMGVPGAREVDLSGPEIEVVVDLGVGEATNFIRTTDLSYAYVEINSAYST